MSGLVVLNNVVKDATVRHYCKQCAMVYLELCSNMGKKPNNTVFNTVLLHGIGTNTSLVGSDENNKAYNYLEKSKEVIVKPYLVMGKAIVLQSFTRIDILMQGVLNYCISHVSNDGKRCTLDEKLDYLKTHDKVKYQDMKNDINYYYLLELNIKNHITELHSLLDKQELN